MNGSGAVSSFSATRRHNGYIIVLAESIAAELIIVPSRRGGESDWNGIAVSFSFVITLFWSESVLGKPKIDAKRNWSNELWQSITAL